MLKIKKPSLTTMSSRSMRQVLSSLAGKWRVCEKNELNSREVMLSFTSDTRESWACMWAHTNLQRMLMSESSEIGNYSSTKMSCSDSNKKQGRKECLWFLRESTSNETLSRWISPSGKVVKNTINEKFLKNAILRELSRWNWGGRFNLNWSV